MIALLVGVVAVVVQLSLFRPQHESFAADESLGRIPVTKAGEPLLPKAVLVSDDPPNKGGITDYPRLIGIALRKYCSEALPRSGAGRQDQLSVRQFLQREDLEILWYAACAVPSHISRAQMADI